jgi:hypothetical protein
MKKKCKIIPIAHGKRILRRKESEEFFKKLRPARNHIDSVRKMEGRK